MRLCAYGDRVIVQPERQQEFTTDSGLYVADDEAMEVIGTVRAVGQVTEVQVDDVVIFPPSAGVPLDHGGERWLVLHEHDILAIWE